MMEGEKEIGVQRGNEQASQDELHKVDLGIDKGSRRSIRSLERLELHYNPIPATRRLISKLRQEGALGWMLSTLAP